MRFLPSSVGKRLQGRVHFSRTRMVVGATVLVQNQDDLSRIFVTSSDEKGKFRVDDLPDGKYKVAIDREGLAPIVKENIALRFPFRAVIEMPMVPQTEPASLTSTSSQGSAASTTGVHACNSVRDCGSASRTARSRLTLSSPGQ